jgi:hypothetical protein
LGLFFATIQTFFDFLWILSITYHSLSPLSYLILSS